MFLAFPTPKLRFKVNPPPTGTCCEVFPSPKLESKMNLSNVDPHIDNTNACTNWYPKRSSKVDPQIWIEESQKVAQQFLDHCLQKLPKYFGSLSRRKGIESHRDRSSQIISLMFKAGPWKRDMTYNSFRHAQITHTHTR